MTPSRDVPASERPGSKWSHGARGGRPASRRHRRATALALLLLAVAGYAAWAWTPWPRALLIRRAFEADAQVTSARLAPLVPPGLRETRDVRYDAADPDARLDVFLPPATAGTGPLPVVVWIHGGAFIAGSKEEVANYLRILAGRGMATVGVDYSLAPGATYPTPVAQVNRALAWLREHAAEYGIDPERIYLAGDSGGAQIAAQLALLLRDAGYAAAVGIPAASPGSALAGVILFCGPYDASSVNLDGPFGDFLRTVLWSYSGTRDFAADTAFARMSVVRYVHAGFPRAFISVGNGDPLAPQSRALAAALGEAGVPLDTLFFHDGYEPRLAHEYQFDLSLAASREAFERVVAFVGASPTGQAEAPPGEVRDGE